MPLRRLKDALMEKGRCSAVSDDLGTAGSPPPYAQRQRIFSAGKRVAAHPSGTLRAFRREAIASPARLGGITPTYRAAYTADLMRPRCLPVRE